MKKYILIIGAIMLSVLFCNVFGQTKPYPFEVIKSGKGKKSIVFIPGFASSGAVWNETKANFENEYTCYTLTMAGFAGVKPEINANFKNWESAIASYIQDQKIEKPIIVGHSMGGGLALAIAADYPGLIDKIVVVDALPCLAAFGNPMFKSQENSNCTPMKNQITAMSEDAFYQMQKRGISTLMTDVSKQEAVIIWGVKSDRNTFCDMYCDFSNTDLRDKIAAIKCPTLILLQSSFYNSKPVIEAQYKNLKTAQLAYANKGLHFIMYDDTEWYEAQLNSFIRSR